MDLTQYSFAQLVRLLKHLRGGSIGFDAHRDERTRTKDLIMDYIRTLFDDAQIEQTIRDSNLLTAAAEYAKLQQSQGPRAQVQPVSPDTFAPAQAQAPSGGEAGQLADLLRRMVGVTPIDPAQVRAIATEVTNKALSEFSTPRNVVIEVKRAESSVTLPADEPKHFMLEQVIRALSAGVNVAAVGPAGTGKTHIFEQAARALGITFHFDSMVTSEYKLSGFIDANGKIVRTQFRDATENGGLYLADEADAWDERAQLWMNGALANGMASFPDAIVRRHTTTQYALAMNTWGLGANRQYVGRNPLDGATRSRFIFLEIPYDEALEAKLCGGNVDWLKRVHRIRKAVLKLREQIDVGTRAIQQGSKLLAAGFTMEQSEAACIWKGANADTVAKVRNEAGI